MALFNKTAPKKAAKKVTSVPAVKKVQTSEASRSNLAHVLQSPRITEKASLQQLSNVYVFNISPRATKTQVDETIRALYNVSPRKIAIVNTPAKKTHSMRTRIVGSKGGGRKAYVYLKKGETITIA